MPVRLIDWAEAPLAASAASTPTISGRRLMELPVRMIRVVWCSSDSRAASFTQHQIVASLAGTRCGAGLIYVKDMALGDPPIFKTDQAGRVDPASPISGCSGYCDRTNPDLG